VKKAQLLNSSSVEISRVLLVIARRDVTAQE
jgi:hypothetical protein